jgi:hypothetical protein
MWPPPDVDRLSHADLKDLVLRLLEEVAELRRTVAAQRDEIARLKGGSGRPNIKPSGTDSATEPKPSLAGGEPRQKGSKTSKLSIHEEWTVELEAPPQGARFKGCTDYVVQDLMIRPHVVNFRCERWQTADGATMTAPLPAGISGHFGPQLRRFVLAQYHQAQVTAPRLLALLRGFDIIISKRQIVRLLIAGQEDFLDEARDVLRAGLSSAKWITVDDTGARHKAANGFCTQIGNAHFAWFGTTGSKNRGNFLDLLRAGHADYVINAEALAYMRQCGLCRSGRLDCAPRPAWRPDFQGQSRSRHGCHRGSLVGQHPIRSSSVTMPVSSMSASMACAGFMLNAGEVYIIDSLNRRKIPASSSREFFNPLSKRRSNVPYHRVFGPNFKFRPALTTLTLVVILTGNVLTVVIGHARPQVKPRVLLLRKP